MKAIFSKFSSRKLFSAVFALAGAAFVGCAFAQGGDQNLGDIAKNVTSTFGSLAELITAAAYVAGFGFAVGAIMKFKAHKDNPTQIPVGTPIALLFVAAALIFLPNIFKVSGSTLFGSSAEKGGVEGVKDF